MFRDGISAAAVDAMSEAAVDAMSNAAVDIFSRAELKAIVHKSLLEFGLEPLFPPLQVSPSPPPVPISTEGVSPSSSSHITQAELWAGFDISASKQAAEPEYVGFHSEWPSETTLDSESNEEGATLAAFSFLDLHPDVDASSLGRIYHARNPHTPLWGSFNPAKLAPGASHWPHVKSCLDITCPGCDAPFLAAQRQAQRQHPSVPAEALRHEVRPRAAIPTTMPATPPLAISSTTSRPAMPRAVTPADASVPDDAADPQQPGPDAAFARLKFVDSYYLIRTTRLVIGRDEQQAAEYAAAQREAAQWRTDDQAHVDGDAPSAAWVSQLGDAESDEYGASSDSLRGLVPPGLPSAFSEHGGPVSIAAQHPAHAAHHLSRKTLQASSSTNSIAPQELQSSKPYVRHGKTEDLDDPENTVKVPVHTADPKDTKKISREHLTISYNATAEYWQLEVNGNNAFVNTDLKYKGDTLQLHHGDEIFIHTISMTFELPNNAPEAYDVETSDSASQRGLLAAVDVPLSPSTDGGERSEEAEMLSTKKKAAPKRKPTIKLNRKPSIEEMVTSIEDVPPPASKGKKPVSAAPKAAEKSPVAPSPPLPTSQMPEGSTAIVDGSTGFQPAKRKGPGRPPKNGTISKRDDSALKKRVREIEKREGRIVAESEKPEILETVRAEQRLKDAQNKAQANGQPVPDGPLLKHESASKNSADQAGPSTHPNGTTSPSSSRRPASPRPARQMSPCPPQASFTEEELKKPTQTYPYLLDEVLQILEDRGLPGDLPTIYEMMGKRWPWFRYITTTTGWQSSIRHNLQQDDRFIDTGRAGKGKLWKVDKTKERPLKKHVARAPPPPPSAPSALPGFAPVPQQNQFGQPQYNTAYVQGQQNGNPQAGPSDQYSSPYPTYGQSQAGPAPHSYAQPHPGPMRANRPHPLKNNGPSRPPSQAPPGDPVRPVFMALVKEVMDYREEYCSRFPPNSPEHAAALVDAEKAVNHGSDTSDKGESTIVLTLEEAAREPFLGVRAIFDSYRSRLQAENAVMFPKGPVPAPNALPSVQGFATTAPDPAQPTSAATADHSHNASHASPMTVSNGVRAAQAQHPGQNQPPAMTAAPIGTTASQAPPPVSPGFKAPGAGTRAFGRPQEARQYPPPVSNGAVPNGIPGPSALPVAPPVLPANVQQPASAAPHAADSNGNPISSAPHMVSPMSSSSARISQPGLATRPAVETNGGGPDYNNSPAPMTAVAPQPALAAIPVVGTAGNQSLKAQHAAMAPSPTPTPLPRPIPATLPAAIPRALSAGLKRAADEAEPMIMESEPKRVKAG